MHWFQKHTGRKTFVEFAKYKEQLFDRWCLAMHIGNDFGKLRQLLLLEEFKRSVSPEIRTYLNKAIRDGKYLARHMPVLGNVHPIIIENVDIFRDVISLLARVVILLIDTATQDVANVTNDVK